MRRGALRVATGSGSRRSAAALTAAPTPTAPPAKTSRRPSAPRLVVPLTTSWDSLIARYPGRVCEPTERTPLTGVFQGVRGWCPACAWPRLGGLEGMANFMHHVGHFAARHKWVVLGAWVVIFAGIIGLYNTLGANTSDNVNLPGTGSQEATNLLESAFPPQQNGSNPLVFYTSTGKVTDQKYKQAIEDSHSELQKLSHVFSA